MAPLPKNPPQQLSLGPLEAEILELVWQKGSATAKELHEAILADPDRELAYASVMTVLKRLQKKGWLTCESRLGQSRSQRSYHWSPTVSQQEATVLCAHQRLNQFLAVGNADIVAAFVDSLDSPSLDKLEAIAERIQALRQAREDG